MEEDPTSIIISDDEAVAKTASNVTSPMETDYCEEQETDANSLSMDVPTGNDQAAENPNRVDSNRLDGTTTTATESTSNINRTAANNILNVTHQTVVTPPPNTNIRDRLFHLIFVRATIAYSRIVPEHLRRIIEFFLLLKALFFLFILLYVHVAFSRITPVCLSDLKRLTPKDGVFRLQVFKTDDEYLQRQSPNADGENKLNSKVRVIVNVTSNNRLIVLNVDAVKFLNDHHLRMIDEENTVQEDDRTSVLKYDLIRFLLPNRTDGATGTILIDKEDSIYDENVHDVDSADSYYNSSNLTSHDESGNLGKNDDFQDETIENLETGEPHQFHYAFLSFLMKDILGFDPFFRQDFYIFEYAQESGYLHLSENVRKKLKIPVVIAQLNPDTDQCFGNGFNRLLIDEFLGYDEILISSIKGLVEDDKNKGFVKNLATGQKYRFVTSAVLSSTYFWSFLAMIVFTFGVTVLLRFSHHLIFTFILSFVRTLEMHEPLEIPAAPLLTIMLALVGLEAIMSETFSDTSTALYVILVVWMADQYDDICCRSPISKRHWPRFFYLYHFAFYAYYFRFNGQYGGLALLTSWCFIQHSMIFFFHHYDLPLVLHDQHIRRLFNNLENNARVLADEISATTAVNGAANGSNSTETSVGYLPVPPVNLINRNRRHLTDIREINNIQNSTSNGIQTHNDIPP